MESGAKNVLDVGAGVFLEKFEFDRVGYDVNYVATEVTDKFIQYGIENGINVVKANEHRLPFDDGEFDVVMCYDVMNHQLDFRPLIEEMVRVCRGAIYVTFFKPFSNEEEARREVASSMSRHKVVDVPDTGVVLERVMSDTDPSVATCCYNYIHKYEFDNFLGTLNVSYEHFVTPEGGHNIDKRRCCKIKVNP
jgi:SAM-dependent methyltransferase